MYTHRLTFQVEKTGDRVALTIDLPCADIPDEAIDPLTAVLIDAWGPLVIARANGYPAFLWEMKRAGAFVEIGGA